MGRSLRMVAGLREATFYIMGRGALCAPFLFYGGGVEK